MEEREWKTGEGRGKGGDGGKGKGPEGRAPPKIYCTPSSSFLEICLLYSHTFPNETV